MDSGSLVRQPLFGAHKDTLIQCVDDVDDLLLKEVKEEPDAT